MNRFVEGFLSTTAIRWTAIIAGGFIGMALLLFGFIYWQTADYERVRIDHTINAEARELGTLPPQAVGPALKTWLEQDPHGVRYAGRFAPGGSHLDGDLLNLPSHLPLDGRARTAEFDGIDRDHDGDDPEIVRAVARRLGDGSTLVIGYDIDELDDVRNIVRRALGLGILPALMLSVLGGTLIAMRAQRRIAAMHETIGRIMSGRLDERLQVRGSRDDLDRLAMAVNGMLSEIERLVSEIRGVGDNIAHDLRTPLTRLRTRLERSRDEALTLQEAQEASDKAIVAVDQALAVIAAVLRIGEIEHGRRRLGFGEVDTYGLLADVVELYEPLADEKRVELALLWSPRAVVIGDRDLLLEALGNIVDNAIKYAPRGSRVELSVLVDDEEICLQVADCGPGIPTSDHERVLMRFYRCEQSRSVHGSGLGLSLVAAIMTLHDFEVQIANGDPGCVVRVRSPRLKTSAGAPSRVA